MIKEILNGKPGPTSDVVVFNAGAGIYVSGLANSLEEGIKKAKKSIHSFNAQKVLHKWASYSLK